MQLNWLKICASESEVQVWKGAGMKNRVENRHLWIAVISLFLFLLLPLTAEAAIKSGGVKIELECSEEDQQGKRVPYVNRLGLMPGEEISYIITAKNYGSDVWIRLQLSFSEGSGEDQDVHVDESWLTGVKTDWIKKGGYWYYLKPLKTGMQVDFCRGLKVPDFNDLPNGLKFTVSSKAEAIQAANVVPDFSGKEPFAGILIEGNAGHKLEKETVCGFEVRYENGAETIVQADGLFEKIDTWMPGDRRCETVVIKNRNPVDIRIKIKEVCGEADEILWSALQLTIRRDEKILYEGSLSDNSLRNGLILGRFQKNREEALEFELNFPQKETNRTAFQQVDLALVFSAEKIQDVSCESGEILSAPIESEVMHLYPDPSVKSGYSGGIWKLIDGDLHKWEYLFEDGKKAKNGWAYLLNPYSQDENKYNWFCFDSDGTMQFGWIRTEHGNWYFCHEISDGNLGQLKRGWHLDTSDQRTYYLDPVTGIMQTGWRKIGEQMYYFTPLEHTKRQNWFWNTEIGRWLYDFLGYRTYGSMYQKEMTPDGYYVDENGVWNGQEKRKE